MKHKSSPSNKASTKDMVFPQDDKEIVAFLSPLSVFLKKTVDERERKSTPTILDLSYDIVCNIFELADLCSAVCLGLANSKLYAYLKCRYPEPISLDQWTELNYTDKERSWVGWPYYKWLPELLEEWVGPNYRRETWIVTPYRLSRFLRRDIYGNEPMMPNSKGWRLRNRYYDYISMGSRQGIESLSGPNIIPHPFGLSEEEWKKKAIKNIKSSIWAYDDIGRWKHSFYCRGSHGFCRVFLEYAKTKDWKNLLKRWEEARLYKSLTERGFGVGGQ